MVKTHLPDEQIVIGEILGNNDEIKKQKDTWVFTKDLSEKSPIWLLKSTL